MNKATKSLLGCALIGGIALASHAQESASATLTPISGTGPYTYALTLTDDGTTPIGSVWYAWTPGFNYLPSVPSSATPVTSGWTTTIIGSPGAASIQFVGGTALQPGQSATFDFTSVDSPATLAGDSGSTPIGTSVAYSGGLFSDAGHTFVVTSTPEPSTYVLLAATTGGWFIWRRRCLAFQA